MAKIGENGKKYILENYQNYIDNGDYSGTGETNGGFVQYWLHYYDYVPDCDEDIQQEFKAFMWEWKNIDYVDLEWTVFQDIINKAVKIIIEKIGERKSFNLNKWSAKYETIDGFQGEVIVTAFNKMMAYDAFEDIAKDFDCDVAYLDIIRVSDDYEIE